MPIYEYECSRCNEVFEVMQRITEEPLATHDGCGGAVRKLISQSSFHLKGSGWYVTDYARKGAPGDAKTDKAPDAAKADGAKTDGAKSEAKSEGAASTPPVSPDKKGTAESRAA
jgi:putative FmdB family regulatory protein